SPLALRIVTAWPKPLRVRGAPSAPRAGPPAPHSQGGTPIRKGAGKRSFMVCCRSGTSGDATGRSALAKLAAEPRRGATTAHLLRGAAEAADRQKDRGTGPITLKNTVKII